MTTFKDELKQIYKKGEASRKQALLEEAKLNMVFIQAEFKEKLLEAASNGESQVTFRASSASMRYAYQLLVKANKLTLEQYCNDMIVTGWV